MATNVTVKSFTNDVQFSITKNFKATLEYHYEPNWFLRLLGKEEKSWEHEFISTYGHIWQRTQPAKRIGPYDKEWKVLGTIAMQADCNAMSKQ